MKTLLAMVVILMVSVQLTPANAQNIELGVKAVPGLVKIEEKGIGSKVLTGLGGGFSYQKLEYSGYNFMTPANYNFKMNGDFNGEKKKLSAGKVLGIFLAVFGVASLGIGLINNSIEPGLGDGLIYSGTGMTLTGVIAISISGRKNKGK